MSFFDEDDEPTRRQPRPRRARPAGPVANDPQQIWVRRAVAAAVGFLLLLVLVLGGKACRDSARENALKDYNQQAKSLVEQSDGEVGQGFFALLQAGGSESPEDLQVGISAYKEQSETLLDQAQRVDVPDAMAGAHRSLLIALELRRDGLQYIAERITAATGDQGDATDQAIEEIAGQMQVFSASDVLIEARVTPMVKAALDEAEIGGQEVVATRRFLQTADWLQPGTVADAIGVAISEGGGDAEGGTRGRSGECPCGTGLVSVAVGDVTLEPDVANRVPVGSGVVFNVVFQNQGQSDLFDVETVVRLTGPSTIRTTQTVETVAQGANAEVGLELPEPPAAGEVYTVRVRVLPVPGEEMTDNNEQTYQVLFTQ
jgi:hypothetical protein